MSRDNGRIRPWVSGILVRYDHPGISPMTVVGRDFIFIHVPKCAGKAISSRLGGVTRGVPGHAPLCHFSETERKDKFTFGFVRNPWDRMVSAYVFITTKRPRPADNLQHRELAIQVGFKRWLMETELYYRHENGSSLQQLAPFQRRSQMYWLDGCNFIGRTEHLNEDFSYAEGQIRRCSTLWYRIRHRGPIAPRNTTRRSDYRHYFDDKAIEFVSEHFAPEIKRFGYSFE
jgi:hypothetical protein